MKVMALPTMSSMLDDAMLHDAMLHDALLADTELLLDMIMFAEDGY
jgi:hypothetical protein